MIWQKSQIHAVHRFRRVYISMRAASPISRAQLIFLSWLIDSGHVTAFTCRSAMVTGMGFKLCDEYLKKLQRIGFTVKSGRHWTVTPAGRDYYRQFMDEFTRSMNQPLNWR